MHGCYHLVTMIGALVLEVRYIQTSVKSSCSDVETPGIDIVVLRGDTILSRYRECVEDTRSQSSHNVNCPVYHKLLFSQRAI